MDLVMVVPSSCLPIDDRSASVAPPCKHEQSLKNRLRNHKQQRWIACELTFALSRQARAWPAVMACGV